MPSIREAKPLVPPRVFSCQRPFSNFQFRDEKYPVSSLARILSQCRSAKFKTIVEEKIENTGFSKSDDEELKKANVGFLSSEITRLSFFREPFNSVDQIKAVKKDALVGCAVLKKYRFQKRTRWIVFESVVGHTRHDNNFLHTEKTYRVRVGGRLFKVRGTLYCQQNGATNVCAHVALRTALSSLISKGDISYGEINSILRKAGHPHRPGAPLNETQIKAVIEAKGFRFSSAKYPKSLQSFIPYQKYLYGSIESGFPALLGFHFGQDVGHIIPILGHTFNEDTWIPEADSSYFSIGKDTRFVPSESWVSTYVAHDDNFGSNYCIPRGYLADKEQVSFVLGILPKECLYDAIEAEAIAIDYLYSIAPYIQSESFWAKKLKETCGRGWVVLRPIFIHGPQYIKHLKSMEGWGYKKIQKRLVTTLEKAMQGYYWMVEVSYPQLFPANRRKLGEILLRADVKPKSSRDLESFFLARLPNDFYFIEKIRGDGEASFASLPSGIQDHVPLYSGVA